MENINNLYFVDDVLLKKNDHRLYETLVFSDLSRFIEGFGCLCTHRAKPLKRYMSISEAKNLYELYTRGGDNTEVAKSILKGLYNSKEVCIPEGWNLNHENKVV